MSDGPREEVSKLVRRLKKIGINLEFIGNAPWIYLDKVNGKKVKGKFQGNHGFTAFWDGIGAGERAHISDIPKVFKKIRETLNS